VGAVFAARQRGGGLKGFAPHRLRNIACGNTSGKPAIPFPHIAMMDSAICGKRYVDVCFPAIAVKTNVAKHKKR